MNIFNKVALQSMKKNRTRTIVTVIGVVLSTIMITAVATFAVSLQNYVVNGAIEKYGPWHVAFLDVPSAFVQDRTHEEEALHTAAFENIGYAMLDGGKNPDKPYLFIAGFSEEAFDTLPITLVSGRLPNNSSEILIPAHVSANGGVTFSVGDTLSLTVGTRTNGQEQLSQHIPYSASNQPGEEKETFVPKADKSYTIVGICERPKFEEFSAPGYTLITTADQTEQADRFSIFITLKNPRQVHAYASSTAENQSYIFNDDVLRFMGLSDDTIFNTFLYTVGGILIVFIMIGSIFLIYNSFYISLNERTHQFGILMSVGATAKQLRNSVLFEGLCIGIIGIPIGILMGIPSIKAVLSIVEKNFANALYDNVPLTLKVSFLTLIAAAVISMITILISAYIPAKKAARTPIMECIRQTNEVKVEAKTIKTSKTIERICGLEETLALKNFKRNKGRYRSIILSLTFSMVLFVSASSFGTNLNLAAAKSTVEMDGDISFYTKDMEEFQLFQLYDRLNTADGVYKSTYQANATYLCTTKDFPSDFVNDYRASAGDNGTSETLELPIKVQYIELHIYQAFIESLGLPTAEYTGQDATLIIIGVDTSAHTTLFTNRSMDFTLHDESGTQTQTLRATFVDMYPLDPLPEDSFAPAAKSKYSFMVVAPYQMKQQFDALGAPAKLGLTFWSENPGQSVTQMQTMIEGAGITSDYTLYNLHRILEQNRNLIFIVNVFTYVFIMMISLIAIANVFNTISTNIRLRRRELAMLRSVGMSDRDFNKMMRFECALYGLRTLLFGLPLSIILSWLIYKGMVIGGAEIDFIFPWSSIIISLLGVFFVIFITMLYAVRKIKKENIIDALRDQMT